MRNLAQALGAIYFRVPRGIQFGLDDVRAACERAGSPHQAVPVIHIAGTNGKGSAASMCASALKAGGYRVGLFTSPHLCRFSERIQIDGKPIDDGELTECLDEAIDTGPKLSFFETTFLTAMLGFRRAGVDVAVIEVGLGGRLDATNVIERPLVTAVTRIALEHADKLGHTVEAIAREKASIAKPGVPMVLGPMGASVDAVSRATARERGASEILGLGREVSCERMDGGTRVRANGYQFELAPRLLGDHQLENAAVAAISCAIAGRSLRGVDRAAIERGIAGAAWPARLELVRDDRGEVLLDAAHNPDGMTALTSYLRQRGDRRIALVFGSVADKDWGTMLGMISPLAEQRFFVEPGGRAAAPLEEMARRFGGRVVSSVPDALRAARESVGHDGLVVVAGSIFLVGNARASLLGLDRDPPVAL